MQSPCQRFDRGKVAVDLHVEANALIVDQSSRQQAGQSEPFDWLIDKVEIRPSLSVDRLSHQIQLGTKDVDSREGLAAQLVNNLFFESHFFTQRNAKLFHSVAHFSSGNPQQLCSTRLVAFGRL